MTAQEYLEAKLGEMASQDPNFRARYEDEQKSMNDCIRYITQQAQKQAVNGCAAISDDEVLQMAVHYYQEKDVNPTKDSPIVEIKTSKAEKPKQEVKPQPVLIPEPKAKKRVKKKTKKGSDNSLQLDLFGGM